MQAEQMGIEEFSVDVTPAVEVPPIKEFAVEPPLSPPPSKVSGEDRLRVENLQLKLEKVALEITLTTSQLNERVRQRGDLLKAAEALRFELIDRYGIDLYAGKLNDDGTFTANPAGRPVGS